MISTRAVFFKFDGSYGGDLFENWLFEKLSERIGITKIEKKRLGGVSTLKSVFYLISKALILRKSVIIRPFGLPIYKRNLVVIFHHYDHHDLKWYARLFEMFDLLFLRILSNRLNIKFICVSSYWKDWLSKSSFAPEFLIYNEVDTSRHPKTSGEREMLSIKYNLDYKKKWVFLGSNQAKKGGYEIICNSKQQSFHQIEFVLSGKTGYHPSGNARVIWLENSDYIPFLTQCHAVIANSLFNEGWCRVVHEAILQQIPAIGSGRGGMSELLTIAGYRDKYSVDDMADFLNNPISAGQAGANRLIECINNNNQVEISKLATYVETIGRI